MKLYLVRHGESMANLQKRMSVPTVELSEKGVLDALNAGKLISSIHFDKVFVSPYTRAQQTQKIALPNFEGEVVDCLHEFNCGIFEGQLYADLLAEYGDKFAYCTKFDDYSQYNGESYADVKNRVREFMSIVASLDCDTVIGFSHAGFILTFFDEVIGRNTKVGRNVHCSNGSVSVFDYDKETNIWAVRAFNVTTDIIS